MSGFLGDLRRRYPAQEWTPVTIGQSGASVWHLAGRPSYYLKAARDLAAQLAGGDALLAEAERFGWLARHGVATAEVVEVERRGEWTWLVTTAVAGRSAAEAWPESARPAVVDAVADAARQLHTIPTDDCPFDRRLAVSVAAAETAAARGMVDLDALDERRAGWTAARLLDELRATRPTSEDLVVCHGDLCLPNVLLAPDTFRVTGLVDVGRLGIADRYVDLALATRSPGDNNLNPQYGPGYADRFLRRYSDVPPDAERLAFYRLLDEFA
jgi:aminoglycoside phosphotransferase